MITDMISSNLRMLLPETLWIEPEHFTQAEQQSTPFTQEQAQWQAYIQSLAQLAFRDWLQEKLPDARLSLGESDIATASYMTVEERNKPFKLCLMAREHVLDEQVSVPRVAVERPERCAHYYVWTEVLEEQQEAVIRGFLRYDELTAQIGQSGLTQRISTDSDYTLPLAVLDSEPNHLVNYVQQLSPSAIALPAQQASTAEASTSTVANRLSNITARLGDWVDGAITEGWQTIDSLINPDAAMVWATRSDSHSSQKTAGKIINLGVQLVAQSVVLLVTVVPDEEEKLGVTIQVLPTGDQALLPPQLKITLVSSKGKVLQEVTSREQDNFVQLRSFKGKPGVRFRVDISLDDVQVSEDFQL